MVDFPLDRDHFGGGSNLTPEGDYDLVEVLNRMGLEYVHVSSLTTQFGGAGVPTQGTLGPIAYLKFTVDVDHVWKNYKFPKNYVGDANFHIHWCKTQDTDQSGKNVLWQVQYRVYDGKTMDGSIIDDTIDVTDVCVDTGTTTRLVHRTGNIPIVGGHPDWYVTFQISPISPVSNGLSLPGLVGFDMTYVQQTGVLST